MSRFWDELAEQHKWELRDGAGYREIARRYITNPVHDNPDSLLAMVSLLSDNGVFLCKELDPESCLTVPVNGIPMSYDSLQTSDELHTIARRSGITDPLRYIVEIGAGYGRVAAHVMHIALSWGGSYTIIDIEPALTLCKSFLACVRRDTYGVFFADAVPPGTDLVISISLFDELTPSEVTSYMEQISTHSRYFYCKYQEPWFNQADQVTVDVGELISGYGETLYAGDCLLNPWLPRPMREVVMKMGGNHES